MKLLTILLSFLLAACGGAVAVTQLPHITGPGTYPAGEYTVNQTLVPGVYKGAGANTIIHFGDDVGSKFPYLISGSGDVTLQDLTVVGNNTGAAYVSGSIISLTAGNITLDTVWLDNVRASYWVYTQSGNISATNVTATSRLNNAPSIPNKGGYSAYVLSVSGGGTLSVDHSICQCDYIKGLAALFGPGELISSNNTINHNGAGLLDTDPQAVYGLLAYRWPYPTATQDQNLNRPKLLHSDHDVFNGSTRAGIYTAGAIVVEVPSGEFRDMVKPDNDSIPIACIALNAADEVHIGAVKFHNCNKDLVVRDNVRNYEIQYSESP